MSPTSGLWWIPDPQNNGDGTMKATSLCPCLCTPQEQAYSVDHHTIPPEQWPHMGSARKDHPLSQI